jgi:hypothetical protein
LAKNGKLSDEDGKETDKMFDIPDGIIAHLTRECTGNVHDHRVVNVTSSKPLDDAIHFPKRTVDPNLVAAKNATDLESSPCFFSAYRTKEEDIPHARNNWVCYVFKERRIVPKRYTIHTNGNDRGSWHLKSWLLETSTDGENWREVAREEDNKHLNGGRFTATFAIADGVKCRFTRLVNMGPSCFGSDLPAISEWEIFGSLVE